MKIKQELAFKKAYKKLHAQQKSVVNQAIRKISAEPTCGEQKKQDLANIFVYKFKMDAELYLLAYTFDPITLTLLLLGVHENFYKSLKNKI